jgi:hypothetical protein
MFAHYDRERQELCLRLEDGESDQDFRALGDLLVQYLDRRLRRAGEAINGAMSHLPERNGLPTKTKERLVSPDRSK